MERVTTANRWLLLLLSALACLALPAGADAQNFTISVTEQGTTGSNGWYVSNVLLDWTFVPASPPPAVGKGCLPGVSAEGVTHIDCTAVWTGGSAEVKFNVSIDKTAPAVHAVASRRPDANGWYNKPVSFTFKGTDATSGVASCSTTSYHGPDNGNASVAGTCTDRAGNVGHAVYRFRYDSTPPTVGSLTVEHGNRSVVLSWQASAGAQISQVTRNGGGSIGKVIYRGPAQSVTDTGLKAGAKYTYTVTAVDEAGNKSASTLPVTATGRLTGPVPGQRVTSRPHLTWLAVKGATYYNVQLIRGRRIFSAWPKRTSFTLPRTWVYHGHRHRLRNGFYRWYVWPGFGKRSKARYGKLVGSSSFVYAR